MKATVKDNKAFCPRCGERNYKVISTSEANTYKGKAIKVIGRCECSAEIEYYRTLIIGHEETFTEEEYNMRKQSLMGSSEFENNPEKLDEKVDNRKSFINSKIKSMQCELDAYSKEYCSKGYGTIQNFQRDVISGLLKEWKKRYE